MQIVSAILRYNQYKTHQNRQYRDCHSMLRDLSIENIIQYTSDPVKRHHKNNQ